MRYVTKYSNIKTRAGHAQIIRTGGNHHMERRAVYRLGEAVASQSNPYSNVHRHRVSLIASIHVHRLALHVLFEHVRVGGRSQLLQRARLDLPYALARDRHRPADLGEGARPAVAQAVAHA